MDEAGVARRQRLHLLALEHHLQRVAGLHQARDALGAAGAGKQPDLDLGQADAGRGVVGDDAVLAGERELEGAAEADAVDRGGEGFPAGLELAVEQRELAALVEEGLHRDLLALLLGQADIEVAQALEHGQVGAAGKGLLAGGDDAALDGLGRGDRVDDLVELGHQLGRDDVHRAAGHVPGRGRDAVGIGLEAEIGEVHRQLSSNPFDDGGDAHAGGDAERHQGGGLVGALQFVEHGAEDHRAGGAERMAHGDRAAIDVEDRVVDVEGLLEAQHDRGKRLVQLEQVDVARSSCRPCAAPVR